MTLETYSIESRLHTSYAEFKKYIDGTYATLAFTFYDDGIYYKIVTEPYAGVAQIYDLLKDAGADQTDFDNNYKNLPLREENSKATATVFGPDASGSAPTKNPILAAGSDGTNVRTLRTATDGTLRIDPTGTTTQPVTGTGTAGSPASGVVSVQGVVGGTPVPISGSITATNPSVSTNNASAPTSSTQIGGTDGTNLQSVRVFDLDSGAGSQYVLGVGLRKAASGGSVEFGTSTDPIRIDPTGSTTQPVSGTVTANAGTGNFTVVQATAASLNATVTGSGTAGSPASGVVSVQGVVGGTNLPVSGTVTANAGSGNFAVNLAQYSGASVGAGNAIHIQPGTGATFTVVQATASSLRAQTASESTTAATVPTVASLIGASDGTNLQALRSTTTTPGGTEQGLIVRNIPSGTQTVAGSGNFTVVQATAASLNAAVVGIGTAGSPSGGVLSVQGVVGGTAIPVSGTVTANNASIGSNNSAIPTSSTQIGGSNGTNLQAARVYDVNSGAGSEYALGVSLRKTTATGSVELGTFTNPLVTDFYPYAKSAFGSLRVAHNYTLADIVNKYEIDPREYSTSVATSGTVTHIPLQSAIQLAVTTASGSQAVLRTNTFYRYQAGKGLRIKQTIYNADAGQTNQIRRWGFFDENDGLFYQLSGTTFSVVRRTSISGSPVDTTVAKSSFNYDVLDGTGPSGVNLDVTKGNIYEIDIQWLGVGTVSFYVNGYLVHQIFNANTIAGPYMKTAQLPVAIQIVNTGASTASSLTNICNSVIVEGGDHAPEYSFCAYNVTQVTVTTTERPVLTIRPKATYNSITNRMLILPKKLSMATEGTRIGYRLVYNGTLTGASYTSVNTYSGVEFDVASTALSGGETLYYGFLGNTNDARDTDISGLFDVISRVLRQNAFATAVDTLTVMAVNEATGSTAVRASLVWSEVR